MTSKNLTRREDLELRQDRAWHVQVASGQRVKATSHPVLGTPGRRGGRGHQSRTGEEGTGGQSLGTTLTEADFLEAQVKVREEDQGHT